MTSKYLTAVGRRKSAVARVRIFAGNGKLLINGKEVADSELKEKIFIPMQIVGCPKSHDVSIIIRGGGKSAWIGASILGLSRALIKVNSEYEKTLKKENLLSRDPREKERKKPGLRGARRAPQWQKR